MEKEDEEKMKFCGEGPPALTSDSRCTPAYMNQ